MSGAGGMVREASPIAQLSAGPSLDGLDSEAAADSEWAARPSGSPGAVLVTMPRRAGLGAVPE